MSVASPCNGVCTLDPASGHCRGCWRSLSEIAAWSGLADGDKRRILALLPGRRDAAHPLASFSASSQ